MEILEQSPIDQALTTANITDKVLAGLKEYMPLTINGTDDKEGYEKVKAARIVCKNTRILAEKICKKGREEAISIQKQWIAKEKEVVGQIQEVELHLKNQEDEIDKAFEHARLRGIAQMQLPNRVAKLATIGKTLLDAELLEMDDAKFFGVFSALYDAHILEQQAALKLEQERIEAEKAAIEVQRLKDEAEKQKQADIAAAAQKAKEQAERDAKEAIERAEKEKAEAIDKAEREKAEAANKVEADRLAAIVKAEKEKSDAIAAEQKKAKDLADKIESDRLTDIEKERLQKQLEAKQREFAPEKDKLKELANLIEKIEIPKMDSQNGIEVINKTIQSLNRVVVQLRNDILHL